MKKNVIFLLGFTFIIPTSFAQKVTVAYPGIYPFKAANTQEIYKKAATITEDQRFLRNLKDLASEKYMEAKTKDKPWSASYWPLAKGGIADPFESSMLSYNFDVGWVRWRNNYSSLAARNRRIQASFASLTQAQLNTLAPSEKYDLLLGDESLDLTNRLTTYMKKWGSKKEYGFLDKLSFVGEDSLDLAKEYVEKYPTQYRDIKMAFKNSWNLKETLSAKYALELLEKNEYKNVEDAFPKALEMAKEEGDNFVLARKNSRMAAWEGICNGWSTAAGLVPRPRKTVTFNLPGNKKLNFYPSDIKGLVSLFWFNSIIQYQVNEQNINPMTRQPQIGGVVSAGLRCNIDAKKDLWGRKYDHKPDPFSKRWESRCAGVHPAIWHIGLTNIIGKQERSFIVERKVGPAVDNHPMYGYKMKFFNPNSKSSSYYDPNSNGNKVSLNDVVVEIDDNDQFKQFRHKKAKYIVGVETTAIYLNYKRPTRKSTNDENDDESIYKEMIYDLELDKNYNIIGGQWRTTQTGQPSGNSKERLNHNQPDFFWVITKNYKRTGLFNNETDLEKWSNTSERPPKSWLSKAKQYHAWEKLHLIRTGTADKCQLKDKRTGKYISVYCERSINKPQPLINVINKLVDLSKE